MLILNETISLRAYAKRDIALGAVNGCLVLFLTLDTISAVLSGSFPSERLHVCVGEAGAGAVSVTEALAR